MIPNLGLLLGFYCLLFTRTFLFPKRLTDVISRSHFMDTGLMVLRARLVLEVLSCLALDMPVCRLVIKAAAITSPLELNNCWEYTQSRFHDFALERNITLLYFQRFRWTNVSLLWPQSRAIYSPVQSKTLNIPLII